MASSAVPALAHALLCAAYLQRGLAKLLDPAAARAEMARFGFPFPAATAWAVTALELGASAMVIAGIGRLWGALALAAFTLAASLVSNGFWRLPAGAGRTGAANGFFEHLGLVGGFLLVAWLAASAPG